MEVKTKAVAKINGVSIVIIENGEKLIAIKPICEALGIDYSSQLQKLKSDEFLSSTVVLSPTVGADEKNREMVCIPFMYVFGWLFTISPKNVKPEAQEAVAKYRMECYETLFKHFTSQSAFLEEKQAELELQMEVVDRIRDDFKHTKQKLEEARSQLNSIRGLTFEQWQAKNNQLKIEFPDVVIEDHISEGVVE